MKKIDYALKYHEMGLNVIPLIPCEKKPLIKWQQYQSQKSTKEEIMSWWADNPEANIGLVTGKISNLAVVDLDMYAPDYDEAIVDEFFPSSLVVPCVTTPRGGQHLYFSYPDKDITINARALPGIDMRGEGGYIVAPPSSNGEGKAYAWVVEFDRARLMPPPEAYIIKISTNIYKEFVDNLSTGCLQGQHLSTNGNKLFIEGRRDQDLFHIANKLFIAKTPIEEVRQVVNILAKNCIPPFPEKEIETKIISALRRDEKRENSLAQEIKDFLCLQTGTISLQSVYIHLQLSTRADRKNASVILRRLAEGEDRILEKIDGAVGSYKILNRDLKKLDLKDRSDLLGELPIRFPFGIESLIKPMPKSVYIIAGETDSGKTAFLMNFAKKNIHDFNVHYFSTEMGKEEFLNRADYFWSNVGDNPNFNFYEHYEDFDQVLFPDDINVIDYLELFQDFYKMAGLIKKIGMTLNKGIALIALQKPKGREEGEGGERTKNLPRLYLSLSPGNLKIVKAKNWRNSRMNPNKMEIDFKLVDGCNFRSASSWKRKDEY